MLLHHVAWIIQIVDIFLRMTRFSVIAMLAELIFKICCSCKGHCMLVTLRKKF